MSETFSPAAVDDERMRMDNAMQSAPIDAQVRRALRYAPNFEGKRVVEAYIEELERERAEAAEHRLSPRTMSEYLDATQQLVAALIANIGKRDAERRRFKLGNPGRSLAEPTDEEVDAYLARDEQPTTVDALALYDKESWDMDQRLGDG